MSVGRPLALGTFVAVVGIGPESLTVEGLVTWLSAYPAVLVLPVIAVTGESVVLAAAIIATQSHWSLAEVALWCFVGTLLSDMLWFRLAGVTGNRLLEARTLGPRQHAVLDWLRAQTGQHPHRSLLFIKFLYGSRFLMIVYLATRRITLRQFTIYDAIGTAAWLLVLMPLGWLLGIGLLDPALRIELVGLAIVLVLLALRGASAWMTSPSRRRSPPS